MLAFLIVLAPEPIKKFQALLELPLLLHEDFCRLEAVQFLTASDVPAAAAQARNHQPTLLSLNGFFFLGDETQPFFLGPLFLSAAWLHNRSWAALAGSSSLRPGWRPRLSEGHFFLLQTVFSIKIPDPVQKFSSHWQMILQEAPSSFVWPSSFHPFPPGNNVFVQHPASC